MRRRRLRRRDKCSPATSIGVSAGCCPITERWGALRGVTGVAVRLFFASTASAVLASRHLQMARKILPWRCVGHVSEYASSSRNRLLHLRLQAPSDDFSVTNSTCAAIEVDFFRADDIANMQNDKEVSSALRAVSAALRSVR
jgi:hypothetical protein